MMTAKMATKADVARATELIRRTDVRGLLETLFNAPGFAVLAVDLASVVAGVEALLTRSEDFRTHAEFKAALCDVLRPFTLRATRASMDAEHHNCNGKRIPRGNRPCDQCGHAHLHAERISHRRRARWTA